MNPPDSLPLRVLLREFLSAAPAQALCAALRDCGVDADTDVLSGTDLWGVFVSAVAYEVGDEAAAAEELVVTCERLNTLFVASQQADELGDHEAAESLRKLARDTARDAGQGARRLSGGAE